MHLLFWEARRLCPQKLRELLKRTPVLGLYNGLLRIGEYAGRLSLRWRQTRLYVHVRRPSRETSINVDCDQGIVFVHIPKTAGTSVKASLGLRQGGAEHAVPTALVHPRTWRGYFTFCVVRNPWDRLVSSYAYHTSPRYTGMKLRRFVLPEALSFEEYFEALKTTSALRPQVEYLVHRYSSAPIDCVCRFENIAADMAPILARYGTTTGMPRKNVTVRSDYCKYYSDEMRETVARFYRDDIERFGYTFQSKDTEGS